LSPTSRSPSRGPDSSKDVTERALDRWVTWGLVLYTLAIAAALLLTGTHSWSRWTDLRAVLGMGSADITYDDGFYYLRIAQHIAHGAGSTFDGVHPTNGYHPLWLLCLIPIFWVTREPDIALLSAVALQVLMMSICTGLTYCVARFDFGRLGAILAALLWVHTQLPYRTTLSGMESGIHAACTITVIYFYRRSFADRRPQPRAHLVLGMLLSLTFLARLDTILLFCCVAMALGWRELRAGFTADSLRRLLALCLPVAGVLLLYLSTNLRLFGHVVPVSGVIKRDWAARLLAQDPVYQAHGWLVAKLVNLLWAPRYMKHVYMLFLFVGSVGVAGIWLLTIATRKGNKVHPRLTWVVTWFARAPLLWGSLVLFSGLQLSFFLVVYHDGYSFQRWYYVIQPWFGAMMIAAVAENTCGCVRSYAPRLTRAPHLASFISIAALSAVPLASARTLMQWHKEARLGVSREPLFAAAQWVGANVPSTAVVGAWNAGIISYLSQRRVVNLDGRVNSWDFYQTKQYDLCRYWREADVSYLVDTFKIDSEVAFINTFYAPGVDLSSCFAQFDRVWTGPAYLGTSQHAMAFKLY